MKKIFYEKVGRRYVPVSEYDSELIDAFHKGTHIVMSYPGGQSRRFNIDPAFGPMIAAGRFAEDAMAKAIVRAGELRRQTRGETTPLTPEQKEAWERLVEVFGDSAKQLEWPSAREVAEEGVKAMQEEADKMMIHPAVQRSWEQFMLVWKLTKEDNNV